MKQLLKLVHKYRWIILFTILIVWFCLSGIRPMMVKRNCLWIKTPVAATTSILGVSNEEAQAGEVSKNNCLAKLGPKPALKSENGSLLGNDYWNYVSRETACVNLSKAEKSPVPAKPATTGYRIASNQEYDFCVHKNGL